MKNTADILNSFLAYAGTGVHYDHVKANVCNVDFGDVNDTTLDSVDGAIVGFLGHAGVSDSNIADIIGGNEHYSTVTLDAVYEKLSGLDENVLMDMVENFSKSYKEDDVTMDSANPHRCKSGYKRKKVIKNGKPDWKCVRLFGKTILSAKQKQALRKARLKAHTGSAKRHREKSRRVGGMIGMY